MPRGVYDRSKVKSQKTVKAPKASKSIKAASADVPKQKRKYTKRQKTEQVSASPAVPVLENIGQAGFGLSEQGSVGPDLLMTATQVGSLMSAINSVMTIAERFKGDPNQDKLDNLVDTLVELANKTFNKSTETIAPVVSLAKAETEVSQEPSNEAPAQAPKRRGRPPKVKTAEAAPAAESVVTEATEGTVAEEAPKAEVQNGQQTMTPLPQPVPFFSAPITQ